MEPSSEPSAASVLVIEDDPGFRYALCEALKRAGLQVMAASHGPEALQLLEAHDVDVVVTDVRLSQGMSGVDVLRRVKASAPDVEVVIMSGYGDFELAVEVLRAGAFDFVRKPFEPLQMQLSIQRAMEHRRFRATTALYASSQAILQAQEPAELPRRIVEFARTALAADEVSLLLPDTEGRLQVAYGPNLPVAIGAAVAAELAQRVAAERRPRIIQGRLPEHPELAGLTEPGRVKSSIVFPLFAGERLVGVLNLGRRSGRSFCALDLERASVLGSQVLLALENARLLRDTVASERLAGMGVLVAGVAHEINNPVAYVLSNLGYAHEELTARADPTLADVSDSLQDARDGALRIRDLVRDLMGLARADTDALALVDLEEAVRSALRVSASALRVCTEVRTQVQPRLYVTGSVGRLSQVFINLLVNAAQAMEPLPPPRRTLTVRGGAQGDEAVVEISDTGPGIPHEHLERIFEPFFTTKAPGRGTGLGLSIARDLVRRQGGSLSVASEPDAGARFIVRLPLADVSRA
ncbi:response regulator [Aggregicoccus sp. 17bor-14]|uniref:hybrid sensor histidine kinase/response regulator n=1 Tax=Myxococcaceae TaxID=31 RepID=UPI00129C63FF|nr:MULTISPECIES: ATP-binding protein [Myxococcaceae]MBF5046044.1 hybrid sensor histidine kinase/response regulator [Simulacricoccus sp. 17bor-14]MRI91774.1 response regulator [Aggregicoccus sp. 17bor-14]